MKIAVIDGQGGGIGRVIVEKLRAAFGHELEIIALGTNSMATSIMLKAGANEGASGENPIVWNAPRVDLILGPIGIIHPNAMLGELTPLMAQAISESRAKKILIPLCNWNVEIAGIEKKPLPIFTDDAIELVRKYLRGDNNVRSECIPN